MPDFEVKPNCNLTISSYELAIARREHKSLLDFDTEKIVIVVKKTENLKLYKNRISATLTVFTEEFYGPIMLEIEVLYISRGPEFRG